MSLSDSGIAMPVTLLREAISERPSRRAHLNRAYPGLSHFTFIPPCLDPIGGHPPDISPRSCRGSASQMKGLGSFLHTENSFSTTDTDFATSMSAGYLSWLSLRQVTSCNFRPRYLGDSEISNFPPRCISTCGLLCYLYLAFLRPRFTDKFPICTC